MPPEPASAAPGRLGPLDARPATLNDQVADRIRTAIHRGELEPDRLYSAYQLADQLGVSRSPVREALLRLAETGLVRLERNRGFRVVRPLARDIAEVFHLRLLLEVPAVRRVALDPPDGLVDAVHAELAEMVAAAAAHDEPRFMRHDQSLHRRLLQAAGNERLVSTVERLRDTTRLLGSSTVDRSRSLDDIAAEHRPILDALAVGDATTAADAVRRHIGNTGRLLVEQALREAGSELPAAQLWDEVVGPAGSV